MMIKRIISALGAFIVIAGAVVVAPVWAFPSERNAENRCNEKVENSEAEEGRTYPHGSNRCPKCGHCPTYDKRIPPEWRREHIPMPLPETEEGKITEIPECPEGKAAKAEAATSGNTAYGWYCMRNSTHTLPPIDRGMEFITECNAI